MPRLRRLLRIPVLSILAVISTAVLTVLLCGYFGRFVVRVNKHEIRYGWVVAQYSLELRRGAFFIRRYKSLDYDYFSVETRIERIFVFTRPDPRPSLVAFGMEHTDDFLGFVFPIWCAAIPAGIAPALWLRRYNRRRKVHQIRGFEVASGEGSGASPLVRNQTCP